MAPPIFIDRPNDLEFFDGDDCPSGWVRVTTADGKFLRGSATYGSTGGGGHTHVLTPDSLWTGYYTYSLTVGAWPLAPDGYAVDDSHRHSFQRDAATSSSTDPTPPYFTLVLCEKT